MAGERLARLALVKTYGMKGVTAESPYYTGMEVKNDTVIVSFDRAPMWNKFVKTVLNHITFRLQVKIGFFILLKAWIQRSKMLFKEQESTSSGGSSLWLREFLWREICLVKIYLYRLYIYDDW